MNKSHSNDVEEADDTSSLIFPCHQANLEFVDDSHLVRPDGKQCVLKSGLPRLEWKTLDSLPMKRRVSITNVRGQESRFHLDTQGFELVRAPVLNFSDWLNKDAVSRDIYPHIAHLIKKRLGENLMVVIFHHTYRGSHVPKETAFRLGIGPPSTGAHVDYTFTATVSQIKAGFREAAASILSRRFRTINVWIPVKEPVRQCPLVLCDYRTCKYDAIPSDLDYESPIFDGYLLAHTETQRWYFLHEQRRTEAWMFKTVDSEARTDPNVAEWCAHTSFYDEDPALVGETRESIEFRAFVLG